MTNAVLKLRPAINVPNEFKVRDSKRELKATSVAHRKRPSYVGATIVRAANLALALEEAKVICHEDRVRVRNAIHTALDDARSAGFSAGCAYMRSK